jgi:hypothetical protein
LQFQDDNETEGGKKDLPMNSYTKLRLILIIIAGLVYPGVFLWTVNTLFGLGIPYTFKTWLASLLFFWVIRFFVNKSTYPVPYNAYDDEYDEDDEYDDEYGNEYDDDDSYDDDDDDNNNGPEPEPTNSRNKKVRKLRRVK